MRPGLTIVIADPDDDYLGLEINARNQRFAGSTRIYGSHRELANFADAIEGFPVSSNDSRHYTFGHFDSAFAGGGVEAHFSCLDGSGRCSLRLRFMDAVARFGVGTAEFSFVFEPASLDRFLRALRSLSIDHIGDAATLSPKDSEQNAAADQL